MLHGTQTKHLPGPKMVSQESTEPLKPIEYLCIFMAFATGLSGVLVVLGQLSLPYLLPFLFSFSLFVYKYKKILN